MAKKNSIIEVAVLGVPDVTGSTLFGIYDLFSSVGRDWGLVMDGTPGDTRIHCSIVAPNTGAFTVANGLSLQPQMSFADCGQPDIVCVPDIMIVPGAKLGPEYDPYLCWVRDCLTGGATVASACSGAILFAEAGLLNGCDATTHWAYCDALKQEFPTVNWLPKRALVASGEGQRIVMAGGGMAWQDLALYLIARFVGTEEAMQVAKLNLINWHDIGQQPFAHNMPWNRHKNFRERLRAVDAVRFSCIIDSHLP